MITIIYIKLIPFSYWVCSRLNHLVTPLKEVKGLSEPDESICLFWCINNLRVLPDYKVGFWPWRDAVSAPTEEAELSDLPKSRQGRRNPKLSGLSLRKKGKKNFYFVKMFFFFGTFLFLFSTIFPEALLTCYLPKSNSFAATKWRKKLLLSQTSFNFHHLLCDCKLEAKLARLTAWLQPMMWTCDASLNESRPVEVERLGGNEAKLIGKRMEEKTATLKPRRLQRKERDEGRAEKRRQRQSGIKMKKPDKNRRQTKNQSVFTLPVSPGNEIDVRLKLDLITAF